MAPSLIALSTAFVLVTALLAAVALRARLSFGIRAVLVGLAAAAYLLHLAGLPGLAGWPSRQTLPGHFDVLGTRVVEPGREDAEGRIELWVRVPGETASRLYLLPYSPPLHEQADGASRRLAEGRAQRGRSQSGSRGGGGNDEIVIDDRPPTRLPSKSRP